MDTQEEPIAPWSMVELGCWFMVALAPVLTWINGPPVSNDQAVVRTAVFALALTGGVVLTIRRFLLRSSSRPTGERESESGLD